MSSKTKAKPVESAKSKEETVVVVNHIPEIMKLVAENHKKAFKIDVKDLWENAWRVNVYYSDDGEVVRKLTLSSSYFVKLNKVGDEGKEMFVFLPPIGKKSNHQVNSTSLLVSDKCDLQPTKSVVESC